LVVAAAAECDKFRHTKVVAVAATAGMTFDFGLSNVGKARIMLLENCVLYFPEGYDRVPKRSRYLK
jgi:hypothetical protein